MNAASRISRGSVGAVAIAAAMGGMTPGCGEKVPQGGRPDVAIVPVAPITFVFHNSTGSAVYVDWVGMRAPMRVLRDHKELRTHPGCDPLCASQCACLACPTPAHRVLRLDDGAELRMEWEATVYELHKCAADPACSCVEPWPATAGAYAVSLAGAAGVIGGVPDPVDSRILNEATLDSAAPGCQASADFELVGAAEVKVQFTCE